LGENKLVDLIKTTVRAGVVCAVEMEGELKNHLNSRPRMLINL
jgi:hypothetical protein